MPSDVDIVNKALVKLGTIRILQLTDNVKAAKSANAIYAMTRDSELQAHIWDFATARRVLPALADGPAFGYGFQYELPEDCLAVIEAGDWAPGGQISWWWTGTTGAPWGGRNSSDGPDYRIEGHQVLTNLPAPLSLRYTRRITDPARFNPTFAEAFACKLAMELCEDLTQSNSKRQLAQGEYDAAIRRAIRTNAIQLPPDPQPDSSWLGSRRPG